MIQFRRRKTVEMNFVSSLQLTQQTGVVIERKIRMEPALHEDATPAQLDHLFDFLKDLFVAVNVTFGRSGFAIKRTKAANRDTHVRIIHIAIDYIGDDVIRM